MTMSTPAESFIDGVVSVGVGGVGVGSVGVGVGGSGVGVGGRCWGRRRRGVGEEGDADDPHCR